MTDRTPLPRILPAHEVEAIRRRYVTSQIARLAASHEELRARVEALQERERERESLSGVTHAA